MWTNLQAVKSQKKRKIFKYDKKIIHLKAKLKQNKYQENHSEAYHNQIIKK